MEKFNISLSLSPFFKSINTHDPLNTTRNKFYFKIKIKDQIIITYKRFSNKFLLDLTLAYNNTFTVIRSQ